MDTNFNYWTKPCKVLGSPAPRNKFPFHGKAILVPSEPFKGNRGLLRDDT